MKVIFLGTPDFAIKPLKAILDSNHEIVAVVCQPDRRGNRNKLTECSVKQFAVLRNLKLFQFDNISAQGVEILKELNADIMVTCAYGQFLSQEVLDITKYGVINIHGSLLPKYRGAAPVQWAIINGDKTTGVTLMRTVLRMDAGDVLISRQVDIGGDTTAYELFNDLSVVSSSLIVEGLNLIEQGNAKYTVQDESEATKCTKLTTAICNIDWSKSAEEIHNKIRGCNSSPVATTKLNNSIVKVWLAKVVENSSLNSIYGQVVKCEHNEIFVSCAVGTIKIISIQFANGKPLNATEVINGRKLSVGVRFDNE